MTRSYSHCWAYEARQRPTSRELLVFLNGVTLQVVARVYSVSAVASIVLAVPFQVHEDVHGDDYHSLSAAPASTVSCLHPYFFNL